LLLVNTEWAGQKYYIICYTKLVYLQTITIKALTYTCVLKWKHIIVVFITPQVDPGLNSPEQCDSKIHLRML